ncbi:hypothetical protein MMRN_54230 [Mycobacterium marinum]|nr:hypothetical protein MMRN_54230 [Mycobacterium marinum]
MLVPVVMVVCCGVRWGWCAGGQGGAGAGGDGGLVEEAACSVGMVVAAGPVVPGRWFRWWWRCWWGCGLFGVGGAGGVGGTGVGFPTDPGLSFGGQGGAGGVAVC